MKITITAYVPGEIISSGVLDEFHVPARLLLDEYAIADALDVGEVRKSAWSKKLDFTDRRENVMLCVLLKRENGDAFFGREGELGDLNPPSIRWKIPKTTPGNAKDALRELIVKHMQFDKRERLLGEAVKAADEKAGDGGADDKEGDSAGAAS